MFCMSCGNKLQEKSAFCGNCGAKQNIRSSTYRQKSEPTKRKFLIFIVAFFASIVRNCTFYDTHDNGRNFSGIRLGGHSDVGSNG